MPKVEIYRYKGYSIVKLPQSGAKENFTYILQENGIIPDSIKQFTTIQIPIKSIIVTSTTHVPALEMLGKNTLVGFRIPIIFHRKTRKRIDAGKIREVGKTKNLQKC
jgi:iron complex transport system substrate-binding protein